MRERVTRREVVERQGKGGKDQRESDKERESKQEETVKR